MTSDEETAPAKSKNSTFGSSDICLDLPYLITTLSPLSIILLTCVFVRSLEALLYWKSYDIDTLGVSLFLRTSPIDFNTSGTTAIWSSFFTFLAVDVFGKVEKHTSLHIYVGMVGMHSWQECSKKPNSATTFVEPVYSDRGVHMEHFVFCLFSKLIAIGIWGSMQTQIVSEAHVILKWKMMSSLYRTYCTLQALSFINVAAPLLKKKKTLCTQPP